jgi:hypothetical protein
MVLLASFGMNQNEGVVAFNRVAFVGRRFIFGNSEVGGYSSYSAEGTARGGSAESGHNRTDTWNRGSSDPKQPTQYARRNSAGDRAGGGSFGRLGILRITSEVARPGAIRQQHGYVVTRQSRLFQLVGEISRLFFARRYTDDSFCHAASPIFDESRRRSSVGEQQRMCHDAAKEKSLT